MIGVSVHLIQKDRLWKKDSLCGIFSNNNKKQQVGLSEQVDFSKFMRLWGFKGIKRKISSIMDNGIMKEDDDCGN